MHTKVTEFDLIKQRTLTDSSINHTFLIALFERIEANNDDDMKLDNELCNLIMTSQKASGERSGETYRYVKLHRWLNIPISRDLISLDLKLLLRN